MDARELKGMQIAATLPVKRVQHAWVVPSQTGQGSYKVAHPDPAVARLEGATHGLTCTCPDFEERQLPCKHVIAVEYTIKRETPEGDVVTETVKVTYSQTWTAYNAAQSEEEDRFMPMLADLCSTLSRPYSGKGRPPLPLSDMVFACVSRVYSGLSARRFDTDVRESKERGLTDSDPHFNSVLRYLRDPAMTPVLKNLVTLSVLPLKAIETDFAVDSTGFSTYRFVHWYDHKWGKERTKRKWVKLHAMCGVLMNVVTSFEMTDWRGGDSPQFGPMLATTAEHFPIREVSADKAYSSKANLQAVADLGATPFIPFINRSGTGDTTPIYAPNMPLPQLGSAWDKMYAYFVYQRDTFLSHYHKRSNVETTFFMVKVKFGDSLRSRSDTGQMNEVLCKVIAHNLCCLIAAIHELGMEVPAFTNSLERERVS